MAKRTRAPARGRATRTTRIPRKTVQRPQPPIQPKAKPEPVRRPVGVRIEYTPATLQNVRHRIEQTDDSMVSIAADLGIHRNTLRLLQLRERWQRRLQPRDLLPGAKLLAEAQKLEEPGACIETDAETAPPPTAVPLEMPSMDEVAAEEAPLPDLPATIERLNRAVLEELAAVEAMRAQLVREPQSPLDAERTARTLSTLTETLHKLRRLQCALDGTGPENDDHDDMPLDIDEFRRDLARRIDEFVTSRTDAGDRGAPGA